ncbi:hypothetical protein SAMN04488061_3544 [Filomicrobium insigne]|uniref:Uncharacterized protein n=1 Tax=Filomicrobium insigne TaxID=418854 RepID=A0A1H0U9T0_9HYPH|nr:hypothetical protein SAMN04488061_3544 [Filomicrobium insigne]
MLGEQLRRTTLGEPPADAEIAAYDHACPLFAVLRADLAR